MSEVHGRHEAERRDLIPGVTPRSVVLVVGVLLLQLGFVLSYIGAFHAPAPREIPVAVVAPAGAPGGTAATVARQLDGLPGDPLSARVAPTEQAARRLLADREVDGALVLGATGRTGCWSPARRAARSARRSPRW